MAGLKQLKLVIAPQVEALSTRPSGGLQNVEQEHRQAVAIDCTALMLGSFRKCDADAPEVFSRAIEHVLARYDPDIQRQVSEPGRWQWPPSAYEVREACEKLAIEQARIAKREADLREQVEERRRLDALQAECKALTHRAQDAAPVRTTRFEQERRRAEQILARYKAEAATLARPPEMPSVFELDPATWDL